MISIKEHILALNAEDLKAILQKVGQSTKAMTRKAQFADALEEVLTRRLSEFIRALSNNERLWLAETAHQGRFIADAEFEAKFGRKSPWEELRATESWRRPFPLLEAVIHWDPLDGERILLPELAGPLMAALPKAAVLGLQTVDALPIDAHKCLGSDDKPLQVFESERIAPTELARVLRLVQAGKIKVTDSSQRPTDASTRLIGEILVPREQLGGWLAGGCGGISEKHRIGLDACKRARGAILLEWRDESLARLIASTAELSRLCSHAGGNRIVVARDDYRAFAGTLKKLGYFAPPQT